MKRGVRRKRKGETIGASQNRKGKEVGKCTALLPNAPTEERGKKRGKRRHEAPGCDDRNKEGGGGETRGKLCAVITIIQARGRKKKRKGKKKGQARGP